MSKAMIKSIIYVVLMALMAIASEAHSGCLTAGNEITTASTVTSTSDLYGS